MILVHGRASSSNVQKVLWILDEIGLASERIDRGGAFGGLDDPAYRALNPNGRVPTVVDGGLVMWESNAILRHYARIHPAAELWPADPVDAVHADIMMDWTTTTLWPPLRDAYQAVERRRLSPDDPTVRADLEICGAAIMILDGLLTRSDFAGGATFSVGDVPPAIAISRWLYLGRDLSAAPAVARWHSACADRPAYRRIVVVGESLTRGAEQEARTGCP